jgi:hypothetical protein
MVPFERRHRRPVGRLGGASAMALLFVLSQSAWISAQERTSLDVPQTNLDVPQTNAVKPVPTEAADTGGVRWGRVVRQTLTFQAIQHSFYMTQPKSRLGLKGPWVHDWFESAASPFIEPHWSDGGSFLINNIGHPMGGSTYAYLFRQNDPSAQGIEFGQKGYGTHLAKAMGMAALWSAQWEIGPFSEASLENVGKPPDRHKMAWVDFVITPTVGVAWMAGEDALDRYVVRKLERKIDSAAGKAAIRILMNPTRSMSNLVAGQKPWKRPGRP